MRVTLLIASTVVCITSRTTGLSISSIYLVGEDGLRAVQDEGRANYKTNPIDTQTHNDDSFADSTRQDNTELFDGSSEPAERSPLVNLEHLTEEEQIDGPTSDREGEESLFMLDRRLSRRANSKPKAAAKQPTQRAKLNPMGTSMSTPASQPKPQSGATHSKLVGPSKQRSDVVSQHTSIQQTASKAGTAAKQRQIQIATGKKTSPRKSSARLCKRMEGEDSASCSRASEGILSPSQQATGNPGMKKALSESQMVDLATTGPEIRRTSSRPLMQPYDPTRAERTQGSGSQSGETRVDMGQSSAPAQGTSSTGSSRPSEHSLPLQAPEQQEMTLRPSKSGRLRLDGVLVHGPPGEPSRTNSGHLKITEDISLTRADSQGRLQKPASAPPPESPPGSSLLKVPGTEKITRTPSGHFKIQKDRDCCSDPRGALKACGQICQVAAIGYNQAALNSGKYLHGDGVQGSAAWTGSAALASLGIGPVKRLAETTLPERLNPFNKPHQD